MHNLPTYYMDFDKSYLRKAIECAFHYVELFDDTVGDIYASPEVMKKIITTFQEARLDYIPEGIGFLRTARLKYLPAARENVILFLNQHETFKLKVNLI